MNNTMTNKIEIVETVTSMEVAKNGKNIKNY